LRLRLRENFDRFNFAIHKEKEMADFRRIIVGLVALFLFAGLASAQISLSGGSSGALQCNASVAVPPQMRAEGLTELVGDILLTCTGGGQLAAGAQIPQANFVVYLNTAVTSRLLPNANNTGGTANVAEPILMIDEPGAAYAPVAAQTPCLTPLTGCIEYQSATVFQAPVLHDASGLDKTPAPNMFQGIVSGNSVTFLGVPVLAPVSSGFARVFRITNIRANANQLGGGAAASAVQVVASLSISGSTSVPVNNPTQIVGYVAKGLTTAIRDAINGGNQSGPYNYAQCQSANYGFVTGTVATFNGSSTYGPARRLRFTENFATAFKTRTFASTGIVAQNIPGTIYNSESGFIYSVFSNYTGSQAGLADFGTRLKAVFNNVPAGVRVFVGTTQASSGTAGASAVLTVSETGAISQVTGAIGPSGSYVPSGTMIAELPVVSGSATAVWEVTSGASSNASTIESLDFDVYLVYTANPGSNSPAPGTITEPELRPGSAGLHGVRGCGCFQLSADSALRRHFDGDRYLHHHHLPYDPALPVRDQRCQLRHRHRGCEHLDGSVRHHAAERQLHLVRLWHQRPVHPAGSSVGSGRNGQCHPGLQRSAG